MTDEEKVSINRMKLFARSSELSVVTAKDMDIVVNLIEKQQKELEELKKYKKYYEEMEEVNKKFIAVDKIKAKIEELEKQDRESRMSHNYLVIPVLQSLLEKVFKED